MDSVIIAGFALAGMAGGAVRALGGIYKHVVVMKRPLDEKRAVISILYALAAGAVVAVVIDHSAIVALMAGYSGTDLVENLLTKQPTPQTHR